MLFVLGDNRHGAPNEEEKGPAPRGLTAVIESSGEGEGEGEGRKHRPFKRSSSRGRLIILTAASRSYNGPLWKRAVARP